ncbi:MAG: flagellar basal body-associated FliL family protein [Gammaproteobacteria bacterium]|nr:flagellar basal body-associated FliL family protein [Gammaproteobacteria bacterium]
MLVFFQLMGVSPVAWSENYPSQQERFKGMGSTFKEMKNKSKSKQEQQDEKNKKISVDVKPSSYFKFHTFVVNVMDSRSHEKILFLTVDIYCEINNPDDKGLINTHKAPIKDSIITHLSGINRSEIQTPKQKKQLQAKLTQRVSDILLKLTGEKVISGLYITRMIIK